MSQPLDYARPTSPQPPFLWALASTLCGVIPLLMGIAWIAVSAQTHFDLPHRWFPFLIGSATTVVGLTMIIAPWWWRSRQR